MEDVQVFDVDFDVKDPVDFACDPAGNALALARDTFQEVCFRGVFILEVLKIERVSAVRCASVGVLSSGSISARMRCRTLTVAPGCAHPCVLVSRQGGMVTGSSACGYPLACTFTDTADLELLPEGAAVPVRALGSSEGGTVVEHAPGERQPVALVRLLRCRERAQAWRVSAPASAAFELAARLWERLKPELAERAAVLDDPEIARVRKFLGGLLHSYSSPPAAPVPGAVSFASEEELARWLAGLTAGQVWGRPLELPFDFVGCAPIEGEATDAAAEVAAAALVAEMLESLRVLNQAARYFAANPAAIKNQLGVWRAMRAAQRPTE